VMLAGTAADDETGWRLTEEANRLVMGSEDVHVGIRAFMEKRPPDWKGR
jgi:enoyl-CoA hydratase